VREHLNVDSRFVHFLEPQGAEIFEPRILLARPPGLAAGEGLFQFVVPVMLFDGNDRTMRFLEQAALPFFDSGFVFHLSPSGRGRLAREAGKPGEGDRNFDFKLGYPLTPTLFPPGRGS